MILNNPIERNILKLWRESIEKNKNIYIAVSYITATGWRLLFEGIDTSKKKIKVVSTIDDNITNVNSIKEMLKSGAEIRLTSKERSGEGFHVKFISAIGESSIAYSGSVNITGESFTGKVEQTTQTDYMEATKIFDSIWTKAEPWERFELSNKETEEEIVIESNSEISDVRIELNEMQIPASKEADALLSRGENKMVLWAATGTGKTVFSIWFMERVKAKKTLFLIHQNKIIESAMRDYEKFRPSLKLSTLNNSYDNHDVIFSTDKTALKYIKKDKNFLSNFDLIIFDECHHIGPGTEFEEIFDEATKLDITRFGMTATIRRTDIPQYVPLKFGGKNNIIGKITTEIALEKKVIVPMNYKANLNQDFKDVIQMVDKALEDIETKPRSDGGKLKGIIFAPSIKEVKEVLEHLLTKGIDAVALYSNNKNNSDLKTIVNRLSDENDSLQIIVARDMLNEGVDIPSVNTIICCRETTSEIVFTQQLGRGLRKSKDKKYLDYYDMVGNSQADFHKYKVLFGIDKGELDGVQFVQEILSMNEQLRLKGYIDRTSGSIEMGEIPQEDIVKMISKLKIEDNLYNSWKRRIHDYTLTLERGEKFSLKDVETKILEEPIQLVVNNFKEKSIFRIGKDKAWICDFYEDHIKYDTKYDLTEVTSDEHVLLEILSWMPLTTSTEEEKSQFIRLLSNNEVEFKETWLSYLKGESVITGNSVQFFKPPHKGFLNQYFSFADNKVKSNFKNLTKTTEYLIQQIKEYLISNIRNDKFRIKAWYSRAEMCFMMDKTNIERSGEFKALITPSNLERLNDYAINGYLSGKDKKFSNFILSDNEIVFSRKKSNQKNLYQANERVHLFVRSKDGIVRKLFNNPKLLMYVGVAEVNDGTLVRYEDLLDEMQYRFIAENSLSVYEKFILEN